ncbi:MAG: winged helix-turn-helix transcriptional regulator [Bacteroidia bacterium]|nr:winged helix-turn-helix transcriptional regulator [Bacteroidia bacterium]MBP9689187.1 winged helix-turn-helix transcriptional regulator [Bacteroidia bacterium]
MAINKKGEFLADEIIISDFARSLGHPARIAILKTLAERNQCICGEIVEVLPLAQSTVSQHLKELKNMGIIQGTLNGPKSCYCINWEKLQEYMDRFNQLANELISKKPADICCK